MFNGPNNQNVYGTKTRNTYNKLCTMLIEKKKKIKNRINPINPLYLCG